MGPCQTSMMKLFRENSYRLKAVNYFRKKGSIIDVWQGPKYTLVDDYFYILKTPLRCNFTGVIFVPRSKLIKESLVLLIHAVLRERQKLLGYGSLFNPLNANPTKLSNTLKQFVGCCRRIV